VEGASPRILYKRLRRHFGFRDWWPGDTAFEVFVGAVLTQQTTWKNVEKAIIKLKEADALDMDKIAKMPLGRLQQLVRSSGYYRQKARRLKYLCNTIIKEHGSLEELFELRKGELRTTLLSYNGIGRETADSIILYAAGKPTFVIDAYTKRAMSRINPAISEGIDYDDLRDYFEKRIERKLGLYKDFHAQFVELGKNYCRKRSPLCGKCPLNEICDFGKGSSK
jgi:endonuclease III related protein